MRRLTLLITVAALLAVVPARGGAVQAQRLPPHRFFGTATVNGNQPAAGTLVEALIGGKVCGSTQTTSGDIFNYVLDVRGTTSEPGCGTDDAIVAFRVSGLAASPAAVFHDGGYERLDLAAGIAGGFTTAALSLADPRPCIPEPGQRMCEAERNALWNGEEAAWTARGVTDPDARFNETVVFRVRAGDPAVISIIARFLNAPFLQVTRIRFVGAAPGQTDEYVEISNLGGGEQDMTGWSLRGPARDADFHFPAGFVMTPGRTCRVYTGAAQENACGGSAFGRTDLWPDLAGQVVLYYDALDLLGHDTAYSADPLDQPPPPNLHGVN